MAPVQRRMGDGRPAASLDGPGPSPALRAPNPGPGPGMTVPRALLGAGALPAADRDHRQDQPRAPGRQRVKDRQQSHR